MEGNSAKSGQARVVQEELASAFAHMSTMEQEHSSTVMVELEEQMGGLNLENNIQPWQPQNINQEAAQHRQRHYSRLRLHPQPRLEQRIRNPSRQSRQQQRINVNRKINLQLLEENMQQLFITSNRTRQIRESHINRLRFSRQRCRRCGRQSRLVAISEEVANHVRTMTTDLNRSPQVYQTPIRTVTASTTAAATASSSECQSLPQMDQQFLTNSTGMNESEALLKRY